MRVVRHVPRHLGRRGDLRPATRRRIPSVERITAARRRGQRSDRRTAGDRPRRAAAPPVRIERHRVVDDVPVRVVRHVPRHRRGRRHLRPAARRREPPRERVPAPRRRRQRSDRRARCNRSGGVCRLQQSAVRVEGYNQRCHIPIGYRTQRNHHIFDVPILVILAKSMPGLQLGLQCHGRVDRQAGNRGKNRLPNARHRVGEVDSLRSHIAIGIDIIRTPFRFLLMAFLVKAEKRPVIYPFHTVRDIHLATSSCIIVESSANDNKGISCQPRTIRKCTLADARHTVGNRYARQAAATPKRLCADIRHASGNRYVRKTATTQERPFPDTRHAGRNRHARQATAIRKRRSPDACHAVRNHNACQTTQRKRLRTDIRHASGNRHARQTVAFGKCTFADTRHA